MKTGNFGSPFFCALRAAQRANAVRRGSGGSDVTRLGNADFDPSEVDVEIESELAKLKGRQ